MKQQTSSRVPPPRLLLSLDSCSSEDEHPPQRPSILLSGVAILCFLVSTEQFCRFAFWSIRGWHPILEDETSRQILARHFGVDVTSLFLLALMGWQARHIISDVTDEWLLGKKGSVAAAGYMNRLYKVHPESIRIGLFFFWYQAKNFYDTIVWNDGPEFIFHHVLSLVTAWVCLGPFFVHYYAVFYLALCEVSTCILCVLANFDDKHGVPNLGDFFPITKIVVAVLFVTSFIFCRCIAWPIFAYYFLQDTRLAFAQPDDPRLTPSRKYWLSFLCVSLISLSILQIAWLGQIFIMAKLELEKTGFL